MITVSFRAGVMPMSEYLRVNALYIKLAYFESVYDHGYAFGLFRHMWE